MPDDKSATPVEIARAFRKSICEEPLHMIGNPGASGSLFFRSDDGKFLLKTVQTKEWNFMRKLLQPYYLQVDKNAESLLPRYLGLFVYKTPKGRHIRVACMNNL